MRLSDIEQLLLAEAEWKRSLRRRRWGRIRMILPAIFWVISILAFSLYDISEVRKDTHEIKFKTDLDTVTYNEVTDTSSFDLEVNAIFRRFHILAVTDTECKMTFRAKDGTVLSEQTLTFGEDMTTRKTTANFSFGEGELAAVSGKVHSVDVELVSANFVNLATHVGDRTGFKYVFNGWNSLVPISYLLVSYLTWDNVWTKEIRSFASLIFIIINLICAVCLSESFTSLIFTAFS